ncbi:hypothetical protein Tco_0558760 [Tanacetum coccineum]
MSTVMRPGVKSSLLVRLVGGYLVLGEPQCSGARNDMSWRQFICPWGLHHGEGDSDSSVLQDIEIAEAGECLDFGHKMLLGLVGHWDLESSLDAALVPDPGGS